MKQPMTTLVVVPKLALVPKLQLGNPESEALASQDRKLELLGLSSQAGAWEQADVAWVSNSVTQQVKEPDLKLSGGSEISGYAALTRPTMLGEYGMNHAHQVFFDIMHSNIPAKPMRTYVFMLKSCGFFMSGI